MHADRSAAYLFHRHDIVVLWGIAAVFIGTLAYGWIYNNLMLANEDWVSFVEDQFNNWDDDAEILQQLIMHFLQNFTFDGNPYFVAFESPVV